MKLNSITYLLAAALVAVLGVWLWSYTQINSGEILQVSTTTSLYVTGLLEELSSEFSKLNPGVKIHFIPVGSGQALELAARGSVDLVFSHAPSLEVKYLSEGHILRGCIAAFNYFIIVGPKDDPAGIREVDDPAEAFRRIYEAGERGEARFVSRGDFSGTHIKELQIWEEAGLNPQGRSWYIESGVGMAKTLLIANEEKAYTLTDKGTFLMLLHENRLSNLAKLFENNGLLINIYSIYLVNPEAHKGVNYEIALKFKEFVCSEVGQEIIGSYRYEDVEEPLFYPARDYGNLMEVWLKLAEGGKS